MSDAQSYRQKKRQVWWRTLVVFLCFCGVGGVALGYVYWRTQHAEEATCLAYALDQKLDMFALSSWRGDRREIVHQQAEAIARLEIDRARKDKSPHCSVSWVRWNVVARTRYVFGAREGSPRWRLVFTVADNALAGKYKYPWPKECQGATVYAATRGPRNWGTRLKRWGTKLCDIGNLSLYKE